MYALRRSRRRRRCRSVGWLVGMAPVAFRSYVGELGRNRKCILSNLHHNLTLFYLHSDSQLFHSAALGEMMVERGRCAEQPGRMVGREYIKLVREKR